MLNFICCTVVAVEIFTMLLMSSNESQAVLGRLFFSPSAATLWRGTPDPTLWLSGSARRPARAPAGPQPGPVQLGDVPGSSALGGAGRVGPGPGPGRARPGPRSGQARAQAGPGGPGRLALPGVSTTGRGGRLRGFPSSGRRAPPALSSPAGVTLLLCLSGVGVSAALTIPRGPLGAGRGRSALPRRRRAARWEPCGAAWLRLRRAPALFFAPSGALAWVEPGPSASPPAGAAGRD